MSQGCSPVSRHKNTRLFVRVVRSVIWTQSSAIHTIVGDGEARVVVFSNCRDEDDGFHGLALEDAVVRGQMTHA